MAKVTKKVRVDDQEPTDEEVQEAQNQIAELQRMAQQLHDLKQAAATGDHKLVFSKLGVKVSPSAPQVQQPQQQVPQQVQQQQQVLRATPNSMQEGQIDDGQWSQINSAFAQQANQIKQLTQVLEKSSQEIQILRAEQQQSQLKNAMSLEIDRLMEGGELPFLEAVDKAEVLDGVIRKLDGFKNTYGYETTIGQVLSEMNNSYERIFDKFTDTHAGDDDGYEEGDDRQAQGEDQAGDDEGDQQAATAPKGDEQDFDFVDDDTQGGDGEKTAKILDPQDEEAKDKLVDGLLEKHMQAKMASQQPNTVQ